MNRRDMRPVYHDPSLGRKPPFQPVRLVVTILLLLLAISIAAQWYANNITLPRYCDNPEQTLRQIRQVLTEKRPAGDGDRKPFIKATRLTFLVPRESNEALSDYLDRLQRHIDRQCR